MASSSPRRAWTATPWSPTSAAATSSWVESGLDATSTTSAPPAWRVRTRLAVSAVTCRLAETRSPASGRSRAKRARIAASTGISRSAQSIRWRPSGASPRSATSWPGTASGPRALDREARRGGRLAEAPVVAVEGVTTRTGDERAREVDRVERPEAGRVELRAAVGAPRRCSGTTARPATTSWRPREPPALAARAPRDAHELHRRRRRSSGRRLVAARADLASASRLGLVERRASRARRRRRTRRLTGSDNVLAHLLERPASPAYGIAAVPRAGGGRSRRLRVGGRSRPSAIIRSMGSRSASSGTSSATGRLRSVTTSRSPAFTRRR